MRPPCDFYCAILRNTIIGCLCMLMNLLTHVVDIACILSNGFVVVLLLKPLQGYKWLQK